MNPANLSLNYPGLILGSDGLPSSHRGLLTLFLMRLLHLLLPPILSVRIHVCEYANQGHKRSTPPTNSPTLTGRLLLLLRPRVGSRICVDTLTAIIDIR